MDPQDSTIKKLSKIQIGFKTDCEKLLRKYVGHETHSYEKFCEIWRKLNFSLIYTGVKNLEEISKQTELFFFEAKKYFLFAPTVYFKTGALYLLYGLYYKQPLKDVVKIRLTRTEFKTLADYVDEIKTARAFDAMYVYAKLTHDGAFDYVYAQTPLAPERGLLANYFTMTDDTYQEIIEEKIEADLRGLIDNGDISHITREYERTLKEYLGSTGNESLMTFDTDVQKELKKIFPEETGVSDKRGDGVGEQRVRLKKKAAATRGGSYKTSKVNVKK